MTFFFHKYFDVQNLERFISPALINWELPFTDQKYWVTKINTVLDSYTNENFKVTHRVRCPQWNYNNILIFFFSWNLYAFPFYTLYIKKETHEIMHMLQVLKLQAKALTTPQENMKKKNPVYVNSLPFQYSQFSLLFWYYICVHVWEREIA